jgi:hypothetical protein
MDVTGADSQECNSGTRARWLPDFGRFSERLSVVAHTERREYLEILT